MIYVASNYGQIKACPICENYVSLFKCEELNEKTDNIEYSDLYSTYMEKLTKAVEKIDKLIRKRKIILENQSSTEDQVHSYTDVLQSSIERH